MVGKLGHFLLINLLVFNMTSACPASETSGSGTPSNEVPALREPIAQPIPEKQNSSQAGKSESVQEPAKPSSPAVGSTAGKAISFPIVWPVAMPVAFVRGTIDEFSTETREMNEQSKSKGLTVAAAPIFLPLSLVAGFFRAPVLAGVKVFSSKPFSKKGFCLEGDLDPQSPAQIAR